MRRIEFFNKHRDKLVGVLHIPTRKTDVVYIIAHGFTSNKDRPRFKQIASALVSLGVAVFRFDFGGSGESQVREITVSSQVDDLGAAIELMHKNGFKRVGLIGESLGGLVALLAYTPSLVYDLILIAPVTKARKALAEEKFQQQFVRRGYVLYKKDGRVFKVPKKYVIELAKIDQQSILSKVKCPTLIIWGDLDTSIAIDELREAIKLLPVGSCLNVINGANHKFEGKENELVEAVRKWILRRIGN